MCTKMNKNVKPMNWSERGSGRSVLGLILVGLTLITAVGAEAQDVYWQRQVQGYLDGTELAVYLGGTDFTKPIFGDIDGDGDGDLYVGEQDGYINVFENLGGNPPNWLCLTTALDSIDVGIQSAPTFWDIDLDGDLDLFIGEEAGNISFYRNEGTPQVPSFTLVTENYNAIDVGYHSIPFFRDLDADGDDDLLVGNNEGGAIHFLNVGSPGNPLWSPQGNYQGIDIGDKSSVRVFDVDGDSLQDLIMGGVDGNIHYFHNDGPPEAPSYSDFGVIYNVGNNAVPALWDLDGDGDLDMISGESQGNLNLLMNVGTPSSPDWEYTQGYFAYFDAGFYSKPALADIDGDQDLDLFIGRVPAGVMFLENVGSADSAAWILVSDNYANFNQPHQEGMAFYDLDDDGDLDLVLGSTDGTLLYYQNDGTPQAPSWLDPVYNYTGVDVGEYASPALADADGDGDADLFVGSYEGTIRYIRNTGGPSSPSWTDLGNYPGIADVGTSSSPAFADLDGDDDLDLLIGNGSLAGNIVFYRNQGTPTLPSWSLETSLYQGWDFGDLSSPCLGDLDNDGDADLFMGCAAGGLYLMKNAGFLYDVVITLLPYNPPIVIPSEGGIFEYVLQLTNNEPQAQLVTIWTTITMPGGEIYGPIDSLAMTLQPGLFSQLRSQNVPSSFPPGQYAFNGYVGVYPDLIYSSDSFSFQKEDTVYVEPGMNPGGVDMTFRLDAPHPNPFNSGTNLSYFLPAASSMELTLYDIRGKRVAVIEEGWRSSGQHSLLFSPEDLPAGIYFAQLRAGEWSAVKKVAYIK